MQLVGATRGFIRRPFLMKSLLHGSIGAVVAISLLALVLLYLRSYVPGLAEFQAPMQLLFLGIAILLAGLIISFSCTFFALRKYLKLKTDQLYF